MFVHSLLTAPLTTSYITLQLSINPQKPVSNPQAIVASTINNLKPQIKSPEVLAKYALLLQNTIKNDARLPFKALSLSSYQEVFRELSSQGLRGLYKGNMIGVIYHWLGTTLKLKGAFGMEDIGVEKMGIPKQAVLFGIYTAIDMVIHPLQTLQSRLILQNANRKLAPYPKIYTFFHEGMHRKNLFFQGVLLHLPKNLLILGILNLNLRQFDQNQLFILTNVMANVASYPFMTLMRRMMCQDDGKPGMLERRYVNSRMGFRTILREEGLFKGMFRGFGGFLVVSSFMMALNFTYQETVNFEGFV